MFQRSCQCEKKSHRLPSPPAPRSSLGLASFAGGNLGGLVAGLPAGAFLSNPSPGLSLPVRAPGIRAKNTWNAYNRSQPKYSAGVILWRRVVCRSAFAVCILLFYFLFYFALLSINHSPRFCVVTFQSFQSLVRLSGWERLESFAVANRRYFVITGPLTLYLGRVKISAHCFPVRSLTDASKRVVFVPGATICLKVKSCPIALPPPPVPSFPSLFLSFTSTHPP